MDQQTLQHTLPSRPHETTEDDVSGIHQEIFFIMESMLILSSVQKVTHFYIMNILNFFSWNCFYLRQNLPLSFQKNDVCFKFPLIKNVLRV